MKAGPGSNTKRVIAILRRATSAATSKYGIGGRLKTRPRPKPTLPVVKSLSKEPPPD